MVCVRLTVRAEACRARQSLEDDPQLRDTVQHNRYMLARQLTDTYWTNDDRQNIEDELAEHDDMLYNLQVGAVPLWLRTTMLTHRYPLRPAWVSVTAWR